MMSMKIKSNPNWQFFPVQISTYTLYPLEKEKTSILIFIFCVGKSRSLIPWVFFNKVVIFHSVSNLPYFYSTFYFRILFILNMQGWKLSSTLHNDIFKSEAFLLLESVRSSVTVSFFCYFKQVRIVLSI